LRLLISVAITVLILLPATPPATHGQETPRVILLKDHDFFYVLSDHIADATQEILISMFLFKADPDASNRADTILSHLITAQKRGVRVRVLLERSGRRNNTLNRVNLATSERLRRHGVQVLFDSPDRTTHTKAIVIDKRFVFIGSHNLTHSALFYNHELSVLIDNPDLAEAVRTYLLKLAT
jgi:phosphatidylserine/phosphatidylglycerophosphate/cardiolipin synthase-like enzyme